MTNTPDENTTRDGVVVRPGQIWEDCDKRMHGRQVRVLAVRNGRAGVEPVSGGKRTVIAVRRMHPISTGYRLVREAPRG